MSPELGTPLKILLSSICLETGTDLQLALYYLQSYLLAQECRSMKCEILTFTERQKASSIANRIIGHKPGLTGFSCYLWNIEKTLSVCRLLKKAVPSMVIVLGGPEVTPRAREILEREECVDVIVRGEGEAAFRELAEEINAGKEGGLKKIKGISFRQGGKVIDNPSRPDIADLDTIPSPYLSGRVDLRDKDLVDVPLETTRGCAFRCSYCYYHKNFSGLRRFSLERTEKELRLILARKPREVYLMDATFNSDPARAKKILRMFVKYNRGSQLHVELKAELLDEETARLLRQARAFNIEIGIQSTNPGSLRAVRRSFDRRKFARGIRLLNKHGLIYEIQLIDALPLQSYKDLKRSLDWLYALRPVKIIIFRLKMLPGTALREQAADHGIVYSSKAPYHAFCSNVMSVEDVFRSERLRFAMERLYDSRVFQERLYALKSEKGMRISDILESWIDWERGLKPGFSRSPEMLNKRLPEFEKYLFKKQVLGTGL